MDKSPNPDPQIWPDLRGPKMTTFVNFNAANTHAKSCTNPKIAKFAKILNHVFKTSKKTQSYSRTYCKIYKIENIGKIGQSRVGLMAKRVIYYGSTRSTLSTPLRQKWPPHFHRWISKSGKKWNYHFWGFLSQKPQKWHFWPLLSNLDVISLCFSIHHLKFCQKHSFSNIFNNFPTHSPC